MGGNEGAGLEDTFDVKRGNLSISNAEQVAKMCRIVEALGKSKSPLQPARALASG
jgi:uncharacterized protein (DUF849 family)